MLSRRLGYSIAFRSDPYRIVLTAPHPINPEYVAEVIKELCNLNVDVIINTLRGLLPKTRIYRWRLFHVAMRFGVISKEADLKHVSRVLDVLNDTVIGEEAFKEILVDKLDLDAVLKFINGVKAGRITVHSISMGSTPLPITKEALSNILLYDIVAPAIPTSMLLELVKRRLLNRKVRLICLMCGKWSITSKIRELPDRINCPKCGSGLITITKPDDYDSDRIIRKHLRGVKLKDEELKKFKELKDKAYVVLTYGKIGVIALSAYGVGPKTALKIAGKYYESEEAFYRAILDAERQYIRTRQYWH